MFDKVYNNTKLSVLKLNKIKTCIRNIIKIIENIRFNSYIATMIRKHKLYLVSKDKKKCTYLWNINTATGRIRFILH